MLQQAPRRHHVHMSFMLANHLLTSCSCSFTCYGEECGKWLQTQAASTTHYCCRHSLPSACALQADMMSPGAFALSAGLSCAHDIAGYHLSGSQMHYLDWASSMALRCPPPLAHTLCTLSKAQMVAISWPQPKRPAARRDAARRGSRGRSAIWHPTGLDSLHDKHEQGHLDPGLYACPRLPGVCMARRRENSPNVACPGF